jgi:hypothetical protein
MKQATYPTLLIVFVLLLASCEKNNKPAPINNPTEPNSDASNGKPATGVPTKSKYPYTDTFIGVSHYYWGWGYADTTFYSVVTVTHLLKSDNTSQGVIFSGNLSFYDYCTNMSGLYFSDIESNSIYYTYDYNAAGTYLQASSSGFYRTDSAFLRNDSVILGGCTSSAGMGCASECMNTYNFYGKKK